MKLTRTTLFGLGLLIALNVACGSKKEAAKTEDISTATDSVKQLEETVMAQHDSSMKLMNDVERLKKQVGQKAGPGSSALKDSLTAANEAMMNWMSQYSSDTLGKLDQTKALDYLTAQKKSIDQVQMRMKKSIADATQYVK